MKRLIALALLAFAAPSFAQAASCICTAGCKVASAPFAVNADAPDTCTVKKGGVAIATSVTVDASSAAGGISASNATVCLAADPPYVYGPAGSKACLVGIPPQPVGSVTVTLFATNAKGSTADSVPLTFSVVSQIPANVPAVPVSPRVTQ